MVWDTEVGYGLIPLGALLPVRTVLLSGGIG